MKMICRSIYVPSFLRFAQVVFRPFSSHLCVHDVALLYRRSCASSAVPTNWVHLRKKSHGMLLRCYSRSSILRFNHLDSDGEDTENFEQEDYLHDILLYNKQSPHYWKGSKKAIVIMPRQKSGGEKRTKEQAQFLLDETIALVESISDWKVVDSKIISTSHINSKKIFGKTNLQHLKEYVQMTDANAVIFAKDIFSPYQHHFFHEFFNVDVYDRFSVVLKIFRERASTKEAKLQLTLAELQYVRKNLHHMTEDDFSQFSISASFGGGFETFFQVKKQIIDEKELKLRKMLKKIEQNNAIKKTHRMKMQIPSVAVVGYTNSGKTSLIKALTHDLKLLPEDRLFATLDVTAHLTNLPSNLKVLLIDTIGFITEIPTALIHSFRSTLSEICSADLLVHVTDCSNPDWENQNETVLNTLRAINVPENLIESMIQVRNKIDKVPPDTQTKLAAGDHLLVSTTERIGLDQLKSTIEHCVIANTDRLMFHIRVPNGGEQYQWLYREASIVECEPDSDGNYMIMKVIVTKSKLGKFMKYFRPAQRV